jgi:hypothetical protein
MCTATVFNSDRELPKKPGLKPGFFIVKSNHANFLKTEGK